jgi:hypothetical protein
MVKAVEDVMTDRPRFEPVRNTPEVAHRAYYGGRLVEFVFRVVDQWMRKPTVRPNFYPTSNSPSPTAPRRPLGEEQLAPFDLGVDGDRRHDQHDDREHPANNLIIRGAEAVAGNPPRS